MLKTGSTIGILGGGQLARMLAQAAAKLGFVCHVYSDQQDSCAFQVVQRTTQARFDDTSALEQFADDCDAITFEFENVPVSSANFLAQRTAVLPRPHVLETTQDRLIEKAFIHGLGIATAPYAPVDTESQLLHALAGIGTPAVLKTRRFGYDGKGQVKLQEPSEAKAAWRELGSSPCILEAFVKFECELSVIAGRSSGGQIECFDVTENEHRDHILRISRAPARVSEKTAAEAESIARRIADALDYVGVLGVELFLVNRDGRQKILVNEIAPRVHNSGHWTLNGATVCQFEQHIRAVAGWPLAKPTRLGAAEMVNLIGHEVEDCSAFIKQADASVHLYGKKEVRAGRKMGHVTILELKA